MYKETVDFIRAHFRTEEFIPLHEPRFNGNERDYVLDCIDSTFVSSVGEYVTRFEAEFAKKVGAKYGVATSNGTSALHIAILLSGAQPGEEIITQSLSFVATANAIRYANCTPHFIDVDRDTLSLSPKILRSHLESVAQLENGELINKNTGRRIRACIPMHTFGLPGRIEEIRTVCEEFGLVLVEDAAESLGSTSNSVHTGTIGELGIFSFNGNKIITAGGGGVIVTDNEELSKKAKHLTTTAKMAHRWEFNHDQLGYNYRMPNLNAALVLAQLEQLDTFLESKRILAEKYQQFFADMSPHFCSELNGSKSNYWLNAICLESRQERDEFLEYTNTNGVMTRPIWNLLDSLKFYQDCPKSDLTNSRFLADRIVNLPSSATSSI